MQKNGAIVLLFFFFLIIVLSIINQTPLFSPEEKITQEKTKVIDKFDTLSSIENYLLVDKRPEFKPILELKHEKKLQPKSATLKQQGQKIVSGQNALINEIQKNVPDIKSKKVISTETALNMVVLELTPYEAETIRAMLPTGVSLEKSIEYEINLDESAALINAEEVWASTADQSACNAMNSPSLEKNLVPRSSKSSSQPATTISPNNCPTSPVACAVGATPIVEGYDSDGCAIYVCPLGDCLTGMGTTIGIIDTGIDYTHPDLGGTVIEERNFERITSQPLDLEFSASFRNNEFDQQISMDEQRIAYYSRNKIYIYDFNSQTTTEINTLDNLDVVRLFLRGNFIVYYAHEPLPSLDASLFLYDLETGEHIQISDRIESLGNIAMSNGKVFYGKDFLVGEQVVGWASTLIMYDIASGNEFEIGGIQEFTYMPVSENNHVVYPVPRPVGEHCYEKIVVYDSNSGETYDIFPPNIGPVLDFKNNEILYVGCDPSQYPPFRTYYKYNLETEEYDTFEYPGEIRSAGRSEGLGTFGVTNHISKGEIGDNLVFFSQSVAQPFKIIAYDLEQDRYVRINLNIMSGDTEVEENKLCFIANDYHLYCHDYNSEYEYPLPTEIFNSKVVGGYDFVNYDSDPMDDQGHGTHVAAIAASNGQLSGIAPDAKIYAYKALDSEGRGPDFQIIAAIEASVDPNYDRDVSDGLDIISLSLGGYGSPSDAMSAAINNVVNEGVIAIVAAGNSGAGGNGNCRYYHGSSYNSICSPGTALNAITVGAVNKQLELAGFSSNGIVSWRDEENNRMYLVKPDVVAPGVNICAAEASNDIFWHIYQDSDVNIHCIDDEHISISGTSMATPHVAGIAALARQKNPNLTPRQFKTALRSTTTSLSEQEDIESEGRGVVNAYQAVFLNNPKSVLLNPMIQTDSKIQISGIIEISNLESYDVSYALKEPLQSIEESNWNVLQSNNPNNLLTSIGSSEATFFLEQSTDVFSEGEYLIRLKAQYSDGQSFTDYSYFAINEN